MLMSRRIHTNDEIQLLAGSSLAVDRKRRDYIDKVARLTTENERFSTELNVAMRQRSWGKAPQFDDLTMLAFRYHGKDVNMMQ